MVLSAAFLVAMSAILKEITRELPFGVILFFRMLFAAVIFFLIALPRPIATLRTERPFGHVSRAAVGVVSMGCYVFALAYLPLADFIALSFTRPLWMPLVAWLMLREIIGGTRLALILLGFVGVVVIARPSLDPDLAIVVALVGGALSAVTLTQVKQLSTTESPVQIIFYFSLIGSFLSLPLAISSWILPSGGQFVWLLLSAITAAASQYCLAQACRLGDATVLAPTDFIQLPFAAALGFVAFSELPDLWTVIGTAIIAAAVLTIAKTESARPSAGVSPPPLGESASPRISTIARSRPVEDSVRALDRTS